jgi:hypothetical protein
MAITFVILNIFVSLLISCESLLADVLYIPCPSWEFIGDTQLDNQEEPHVPELPVITSERGH